jgi:hypothetical protein
MFGWLIGKKKGKKPEKKKVNLGDQNTYHIAQGNVPFDSQKVQALAFAVDEGYPDQQIITIGEGVEQEVEKAKRNLEKVI